MIRQKLPEILVPIASTLIKEKLATAYDVELATDIFMRILNKKPAIVQIDGLVTDLFLKALDLIAHCDRSPTFEAQVIETVIRFDEYERYENGNA